MEEDRLKDLLQECPLELRCHVTGERCHVTGEGVLSEGHSEKCEETSGELQLGLED